MRFTRRGRRRAPPRRRSSCPPWSLHDLPRIVMTTGTQTDGRRRRAGAARSRRGGPRDRPPHDVSGPRLADLGHAGRRGSGSSASPPTAAVFATALHELTPKAPFQASPRAWLDTFDGTYSTGTTVRPGVVAAARRCSRPPSCPASTWPSRASGRGPRCSAWSSTPGPTRGLTGHVVVDIGAQRTEVPVDVAAAHVLDIAVVHPGGLVDTRVFFRRRDDRLRLDPRRPTAAADGLGALRSASTGCRPRPAAAVGLRMPATAMRVSRYGSAWKSTASESE